MFPASLCVGCLPVIQGENVRGRFICVQCVLSPLVLREGIREELTYIVFEKDVCCLQNTNQKAVDMNVILW